MNESFSSVETILLGTGYTLRQLADVLPEGSTLLTSTSSDKVDGWRDVGYPAAVVDYRDAASVERLFQLAPNARVLVDGVPPQFGDPERDPLVGVRTVCRAVHTTKVEQIVYLSTTGVFGTEDGGHVHEGTLPAPKHPRSRARLDSEVLYRASGVASISLRIPAIYGPGRGIGLSLRDGTYRIVADGHRWTNRVHVADLVEVLARIVMGGAVALPEILCVADDLPAQAREVVEYYCSKFGYEFPSSITVAEAEARGLHTMLSNQRVSNERMKELLGLRLRFPSYREGAGSEFGSREVE